MIRIIDVRKGDAPPEPAGVALEEHVLAGVRDICEQVAIGGDAALAELTERFDGADIAGRIVVPAAEIDAAAAAVDPVLHEAIERMADRLRDLHERQLPQPWSAERDGVVFGEVVKPLASVGCYVPGGRAAYPSTVLMTAVPARVAGVGRVVLCTPPAADRSIHPLVLDAARVAGVDAVYRVGGAQAIAAMAYGTETIAAVDKIVGPGNAWVTAAKHELSGVVGIDTLAGPSELVIIADGTADPAALAVDMLAQAEHDPDARTTLVVLDEALADAMLGHLGDEVAASPRREIVEAALEHAVIVVAGDETLAAAVTERLAPEHLQIVTAQPIEMLERVRSYGAAFLGPSTPVSFGDYGAGSNHVLPTMGNAAFASGLRAADFVTVSSVVEATGEAAARLGPEIEAIAEAEGLPGHARASRIRRV